MKKSIFYEKPLFGEKNLKVEKCRAKLFVPKTFTDDPERVTEPFLEVLSEKSDPT